MAIDHQIDEQTDELVFSALRMFDKAEKFLSERYETARRENDHENLEYVLQKLAFLHGLRKDHSSAEETYIQWENESRDPSLAKLEYAFFLFSLANDHKKALAKAEEVERVIESKMKAHTVSQAEARSLFRALHIKGRSLLKLNRRDEVVDTINRINRLVQQNQKFQFGFELDFVEECLSVGLALDECETYLRSAHWSSHDSDVFGPRRNEALKQLASLRK